MPFAEITKLDNHYCTKAELGLDPDKKSESLFFPVVDVQK